MRQALADTKRHRRLIPSSSLSALEIIVLAPAAALLALWVIPGVFDIEWNCVGQFGAQTTRGDSFGDALTVAGTLGWVAVFVATLYAHIAERPRIAVLIPLCWFVVLVVGTFAAAVVVGPATCPDGMPLGADSVVFTD